MLKKIAVPFLALFFATSQALAGSSTIAVTPGTGATYQVITNGSSNFVGMFGLCDGVAAAQCVAVKAASTAAGATDPALVVAISPNNGVNQAGTWTVQPGNTPNTTPWLMNVTQWASGTLGAMANYGTSPGSVLVPGVNADVTNVNPNGSAVSASSSPVVIASDQAAVATKAASSAISDLAHGQGTMAASVPVAIASNQSAVPVSATTYPATAVPITASATGTTAATTATLTNVSGHTTYICGFSIRANATAAATGNATVTGTITATMNFTQWTAPNASGLGVTEEIFSPCVPASAVSTSIAVVSAAPGTGGVVSVSAWGYSI